MSPQITIGVFEEEEKLFPASLLHGVNLDLFCAVSLNSRHCISSFARLNLLRIVVVVELRCILHFLRVVKMRISGHLVYLLLQHLNESVKIILLIYLRII